jgi:hypothetical protein
MKLQSWRNYNVKVLRNTLYYSTTTSSVSKRNETKRNETKRNETKRNETKRNETKRNETKRNETEKTEKTKKQRFSNPDFYIVITYLTCNTLSSHIFIIENIKNFHHVLIIVFTEKQSTLITSKWNRNNKYLINNIWLLVHSQKWQFYFIDKLVINFICWFSIIIPGPIFNSGAKQVQWDLNIVKISGMLAHTAFND